MSDRYSNVGRKPLPEYLKHRQLPGNYVAEVRHWHRDLVDFFLQNPRANQNDAAAHFDKTPAWISKVVNSDAFQQYYSQRLKEHQSKVSQEIINKTQELTRLGLENLTEKLSTPETAILMKTDEVKDITSMGLRALGFGISQGTRVNVDARSVNFGDVDPQVLQNARSMMDSVAESNTQEREELEDVDGEVDYEILPPE